MSLPAVVDALVASGATPEMIAAAVRAYCEAQPARSKHADAQARYRAASKQSRVITRDHGDDGGDAENNKKETSPTPPKEKTTSLTYVREKSTARGDEFDRVRQAYPKRIGGDPRKTALRALDAALKRGADIEAIVAGAQAFATFRAGDDPKFTPMLATWLNQDRWTEDYSNPPRAGPRLSRLAEIAAGDIFDEPADQHHDKPNAASGADASRRGPAGPLSERDGADGGGAVVDLRRTRSGWS